jgi:hypothetical protein
LAEQFNKLQIGKLTTDWYLDLLFSRGMSVRLRFTEFIGEQMAKAQISLDNIIQAAIDAKEVILADLLERLARISELKGATDFTDNLNLIVFENGIPAVPEAVLIEIEESQTTYAHSEQGISAYRLQQRALKALNDYVGFLRTDNPLLWTPYVDGNLFFTEQTSGEVRVVDVDLEWVLAQKTKYATANV